MAKGSDSNSVYSGLYKTRRSAIKAAKASQNKLGGRWYVVKLGDSYTDVHEHYLYTHNVKAFSSNWIKTIIVRFNLFLMNNKWLTEKK